VARTITVYAHCHKTFYIFIKIYVFVTTVCLYIHTAIYYEDYSSIYIAEACYKSVKINNKLF
jgi:hypothetical protein